MFTNIKANIKWKQGASVIKTTGGQ